MFTTHKLTDVAQAAFNVFNNLLHEKKQKHCMVIMKNTFIIQALFSVVLDGKSFNPLASKETLDGGRIQEVYLKTWILEYR